jgi:prolyl oligopeptidase
MARLTQARILWTVVLLCSAPVLAQDISTPTVDAADTYHGVTVRDPYRWLEDAAAPEVQAWTRAQNARTRAYLDARPGRARIEEKLTALITRAAPSFYSFKAAGKKLFAMRNDPAKQQPMLAALDSIDDLSDFKVILDPNLIDAKGSTTIDWFRPSRDGRLVAVSLSQHGSEIGTLRLYDAASGSEIGEPIPRVQAPTAGGSLAWSGDGAGFWYTRYPGDERPEAERFFYQQVYFHRMGGDWRSDPLVLGSRDGLPRVAEIFLSSQHLHDTAIAQVQNGDGGEYAHYVLSRDGALQLAAFDDRIAEVASGPDGAVFALSRAGAPNGKILKLKPPFVAHALPGADVIVPETNIAIELGGALTVTRTHLLVRDIVGGPNQVRLFDHSGQAQGLLPLPEAAAVGDLAPLGDGGLLYAVRTYLRPRQIMRWDATTGKSETKFTDTAPYGFDDVELVREFAVSKDGTRVPIDIIRKKGTALDGSNPTLLYGYGGYGISLQPGFLNARTRLWLDGGGIYAIAIIRGGGEFGERWHLAGNLTHKQNVFDDFAAAARHLLDRNYTTTARLALLGESNGGLLMGATLTQHPQLARAVVARVGIYDAVRAELGPNGEYNTTEFGSVKDPAQFKALYAYSPYHNVILDTAYPGVLLTAGENDGRVDPMHSRKFAAALQNATASGFPVLLRINTGGHGMGRSRNERIEEDTDILTFLYDQLGMAWPK